MLVNRTEGEISAIPHTFLPTDTGVGPHGAGGGAKPEGISRGIRQPGALLLTQLGHAFLLIWAVG